jgi:hypothetical protein
MVHSGPPWPGSWRPQAGARADIHGHRRLPSSPVVLQVGLWVRELLHQQAHHELARIVPSAILLQAHQKQSATSKLSRLVREISPLQSARSIEWFGLARGRPSLHSLCSWSGRARVTVRYSVAPSEHDDAGARGSSTA